MNRSQCILNLFRNFQIHCVDNKLNINYKNYHIILSYYQAEIIHKFYPGLKVIYYANPEDYTYSYLLMEDPINYNITKQKNDKHNYYDIIISKKYKDDYVIENNDNFFLYKDKNNNTIISFNKEHHDLRFGNLYLQDDLCVFLEQDIYNLDINYCTKNIFILEMVLESDQGDDAPEISQIVILYKENLIETNLNVIIGHNEKEIKISELKGDINKLNASIRKITNNYFKNVIDFQFILQQNSIENQYSCELISNKNFSGWMELLDYLDNNLQQYI